jgi:hypothetical protein
MTPLARIERLVRSPSLPPLAAALSAEAHPLASLPFDTRPPDMLGVARVMKLMTPGGRRMTSHREPTGTIKRRSTPRPGSALAGGNEP